MMPPAPPPAAEGSGSRSSRAAALSEMQHTKKPAPASLKRVEQLLLEGERLPFELTKVLILLLLLLLISREGWRGLAGSIRKVGIPW
jgi:hypothetical protein